MKPVKDIHAVHLGSRGGKARAKKLPKADRVAIAKKANAKRWEGHKPKKT